MANFIFKANFNGYNELRKSDPVTEECKGYALKIQQAAGKGFEVEERQYTKRNGVVVKPATTKDYFRNLNGNILEKAWRSVRS